MVYDMDFTGLHIDIALRQLLSEIHSPGEAQKKIEKMGKRSESVRLRGRLLQIPDGPGGVIILARRNRQPEGEGLA